MKVYFDWRVRSRRRRMLGACWMVFGALLPHVQVSMAAPVDAGELEVPAVQRMMLGLARQALTVYLTRGVVLAVPAHLPAVLARPGAVFVTVEKRGQVMPRGCRGTLRPAYPSLAAEIIHNAVAAATRDGRVPPLRVEELARCLISLTVVRRVVPLASLAQHDAEHNGLIAQSGDAIGIVLPFEGHDPAVQLAWACRKAGLADDARVQLSELLAVRFRESGSAAGLVRSRRQDKVRWGRYSWEELS